MRGMTPSRDMSSKPTLQRSMSAKDNPWPLRCLVQNNSQSQAMNAFDKQQAPPTFSHTRIRRSNQVSQFCIQRQCWNMAKDLSSMWSRLELRQAMLGLSLNSQIDLMSITKSLTKGGSRISMLTLFRLANKAWALNLKTKKSVFH